jgi:hypothetical protein
MTIVGTATTYLGTEIPGLKGGRVRIFGILRGALRRNVEVDSNDYFVSDDEQLQRLGGVVALDRVDIAHLRPDGSASLVHCDARAVDLECFAYLAR